jgi:putative ABC transport system permease protein
LQAYTRNGWYGFDLTPALDSARLLLTESRFVKFVPLIWAGLARTPVRTNLTFCSIVLAFALFGVLQGTTAALDRIVDRSGGTRLRVTNRIDLGTGLPLAYRSRIEPLPGVKAVTYFTWFGGYFQDPKFNLNSNAIDPVSYFAIFPEWDVPGPQYDAMLRTRTGAIVGAELAGKFGWKVGDRVPLISKLWTQKSSAGATWTFDVVGIYRSRAPGVPANQFFINYSYLDEARSAQNGTVMQLAVRVADPARASSIAQDIDELFTNSSAATYTQDESDWLRSNVSNIDNIAIGARVVVSAVLFTLLIVIGITMLQSIHERIPEFAVLKAYGYPNTTIVTLIVAESSSLCLAASAVGLGCAVILFPRIFSIVAERHAPLPSGVIAVGFALSALLAVAGAILPCWRMRQLSVVEALAQNGGHI